jgi:hypothetical protein
MSQQDNSNNYIHTLLNNRIVDLSNNPRSQFLSMLVNLMNDSNINENLTMLPLANNFVNPQRSQISRINELLTRTLMEKTPYKKILSNKGEEQLKTIKYSKEKFDQDSCCIMFVDFEEGQDVIQLPCGHIFDPDGIKTWVKEEQAKCPICRFELDFKEVKEDDLELEDVDSDSDDEFISSTDISQNRYNQMFNNMGFLYSPLENLNRPIRRNLINQRTFVNEFINIENEYIENRHLQNAIMASIYEQQGITDSSTDEDLTHLEAFDDDDDL